MGFVRATPGLWGVVDQGRGRSGVGRGLHRDEGVRGRRKRLGCPGVPTCRRVTRRRADGEEYPWIRDLLGSESRDRAPDGITTGGSDRRGGVGS